MSRETDQELIKLIEGVPLFQELGPESIGALASVSHLRTIPKGKILFQQGDPANAFFVVQSGNILLTLSMLDGRELVINEMHVGDCFGELALLTGQPRSTGAVANEPSKVIWIPRQRFLRELESEPQLMRQVLQTTAKRLQVSSSREGALAFLDASARLANTLLQLYAQSGEEGEIEISQEELGQRVGLSRQTVAKSLGEWRRKGWVVTKRGKIELINFKALQDQADET
jgi:CRP-like cAMP-binding protein